VRKDVRKVKMTKQCGDYDILTIPGLGGSGPGHWQTLWERAHPEYRRVEQRDWNNLRLDEWVERIEVAVSMSSRPVVLVAHSFGCLAAIRCASRIGVRGVLLVAPADPDRFGVSDQLPWHALGFPTILVASSNDPWLSLARAQQIARQWGSRFINLGAYGHINAESGLGPWPDGEALVDELRLVVGEVELTAMVA
jgi:predicted alpha/beta hydrolase family esterase